MTKNTITQAILKTHLNYDSNTGVFTRLIRSSKSVKIGDIAGTKNTRYVVIYLLNTSYLAHRLAWLYVHGEWPKDQIDHINGIGTDNRTCNLRECNMSQNLCNIVKRKNTISGFRGVYFNKRDKNWIARATIRGKCNIIGRFDSPQKASVAYNNFTKENHGEFYRE